MAFNGVPDCGVVPQQNCDGVDKYQFLRKIGQGAYGVVFKARDKRDGRRVVALKKVLLRGETEGFPITALREIKLLQQIDHDNVVRLLEVCHSAIEATYYLVFEFCDHDLVGLLHSDAFCFSYAEIKEVAGQLLTALRHLHDCDVIHRDVKTANILVTREGVLKLADFGLARSLRSTGDKAYTSPVVTLWYRPPELLLGAKDYGPAVDVWGAGCVFGELFRRTPLLQGNTEQRQLSLITALCGTIDRFSWPAVERLPLYHRLAMPTGTRATRESLWQYVADPLACDLFDRMLCLDPAKRISAVSALQHGFFFETPLPCT